MTNINNQVILIGYLGADPETRNLESGNQVTRLRLATTEKYTDRNGEKQETTEWHTVIGWGKLSEIMEQIAAKGAQVAIRGKLTHRSYDDKDGIKRYISEVVASDFMLLSSKKDREQVPSSETTKAAPQQEQVSANHDDDLPF